MATALPPTGVPLVPVRLQYWPQVTADVTDAAVKEKCPCKGRVVRVIGKGRAIGGGTPFTDVDVEVLVGSNALVSPKIPVVDGSALTAGGSAGTLTTVEADLEVDEDDVFHLKLIDVTGGASSPTLDGLEVIIWIARG